MKARATAECLELDPTGIWAELEVAGPQGNYRKHEEYHSWLGAGDSDERFRAQYQRRRTFIAYYAWAVPTREAIRTIASFLRGRSLLEVGAGFGLWARLLSEEGVPVITTDLYPPPSAPYVPIEVLGAEDAVRRHSHCQGLLVCWPPYRQGCAYRALQAFSGDRLVYVGDARFTANEAFHELVEREWELHRRIALPSWPGLDDSVRLFVRRSR